MAKKPVFEPPVEQTGVLLDLDSYREKRTQEGTWPPSSEETKEFWQNYLERKGKVKFDHAPFRDLQPPKQEDRQDALWGPDLPRDEQNRLMDEMIKRDQAKLGDNEDDHPVFPA